MKRFYRSIVSVLIILTALSVSAASTESTVAKDKAQFGVRAKFDLTTTRTVTEITGWGPGGMAGIAGYVPFAKHIYFSPGLMVGCKTVKLDGIAGTEKTPIYFDGNMNIIGAEIPLDLGVNLVRSNDVRFSVFTGPRVCFNFAVKGNYDMKNPETGMVYLHHSRNLDEFNGFEIDWGFGVAVDYKRHWHLQLGADLGLTTFAKMNKVYPDGWASFKRLGLSLGLGYNF